MGKPISGNVTEPPGLRRLLDAFRAYINKEIDWWQVEKAAIERDKEHQAEVRNTVLDEVNAAIAKRDLARSYGLETVMDEVWDAIEEVRNAT